MSEVNPLGWVSPFEVAGQLHGLDERRARVQAGQALSAGDYGAAGQALGGQGLLGDQVALQGAQREQEAAQQEQLIGFLGNVGRSLRAASYEQRNGIRDALRPTLEQIYPPEILTQLYQVDLTDQNLDALLRSLGEYGETQRFNTRTGVIEADPYGGVRTLYEVPVQEDMPVGMRRNPDTGAMEWEPGYLEAQRALSAARRAPPRPRASGGGRPASGGSGGGSRPQSPPARGGGLPPGFRIRGS